MKILVDINHPAHIHFFKHFIWEMKRKGHSVIVVASKKDITYELLSELRINYINIGTYGNNVIQKAINVPFMAFKMFKIAKKIKPDIMVSYETSRITHAALILKIPTLVFINNEHAVEQAILYKYFATKLISSTNFYKNFGVRHIKVKSILEYASLHPNWFKPNPYVLKKYSIDKSKPFFIVRFVAWNASHDVKHYGFNFMEKVKIVNYLSSIGRVIISSEYPVEKELQEYELNIRKQDMHDLLYYSSVYIGEGGTMACESALLGTPAIYVNSIKLGYINELSNRFNIVKQELDFDKIITLINYYLDNEISQKVIRGNIADYYLDITSWMLDYVKQFTK